MFLENYQFSEFGWCLETGMIFFFFLGVWSYLSLRVLFFPAICHWESVFQLFDNFHECFTWNLSTSAPIPSIHCGSDWHGEGFLSFCWLSPEILAIVILSSWILVVIIKHAWYGVYGWSLFVQCVELKFNPTSLLWSSCLRNYWRGPRRRRRRKLESVIVLQMTLLSYCKHSRYFETIVQCDIDLFSFIALVDWFNHPN